MVLHRDDWILSNTSNVHVCNDRSLFPEFRPFETYLGSYLGSHQTPVGGVGIVMLDCKTSLTLSGPKSHGLVKLENVLYAPTVICNIFKFPDPEKGCTIDMNSSGAKIIQNGRTRCIFEGKTLFQLRLYGQPSSHSRAKKTENTGYIISATWPMEERQKFQASIDREGDDWYTSEERRFLKDNFGGEFHFLVMYGLKMHNEEDRAEGRRILRAIREEDDE